MTILQFPLLIRLTHTKTFLRIVERNVEVKSTPCNFESNMYNAYNVQSHYFSRSEQVYFLNMWLIHIQFYCQLVGQLSWLKFSWLTFKFSEEYYIHTYTFPQIPSNSTSKILLKTHCYYITFKIDTVSLSNIQMITAFSIQCIEFSIMGQLNV